MRPTKSSTSSSLNALSSESIGTACRILAKPRDGAAPTRFDAEVYQERPEHILHPPHPPRRLGREAVRCFLARLRQSHVDVLEVDEQGGSAVAVGHDSHFISPTFPWKGCRSRR